MSQIKQNVDSPKQIISKKYLFFSISLSLLTMAGVIWYTYTPGILAYLAPKRLPGLGIALVVSFLSRRASASLTARMTGVLPAASRYTPTPRSTFCGLVSFLKAYVMECSKLISLCLARACYLYYMYLSLSNLLYFLFSMINIFIMNFPIFTISGS